MYTALVLFLVSTHLEPESVMSGKHLTVEIVWVGSELIRAPISEVETDRASLWLERRVRTVFQRQPHLLQTY